VDNRESYERSILDAVCEEEMKLSESYERKEQESGTHRCSSYG
jgi:hypothetical protein